MTEEHDHHENRVSHIENKVSKLEAAISNTQDSIRSLAENTEKQLNGLATTTEAQIERLARSINKMSDMQISGQRTNWSQIWSAAGVVVVLFGALIGGFVLSPQHRLEDGLEKLESAYALHVQDGHPKSVVDKMNTRFNFAVETIQAQHAQQNITNNKLDTEIDKFHGWKNKYTPIIATLETKVDKLDKEGNINLRSGVEQHNERLRGIEREIYPNAKYNAGRP